MSLSSHRQNAIDFTRSYECYIPSLRNTSNDQARGDCPLCSREDKFYINRNNGLWDCKVCGEKGNLITFFGRIWELLSDSTTISNDYKVLAEQRGLLNPTTLEDWGIVMSLSGTWLVPGFNSKGSIVQLYRYIRDVKSGKMRLYATPGASSSVKYEDTDGSTIHSGHGICQWIGNSPEADTIYIFEGCWDGIALTEVLDSPTGQYSIYAVPGVNTFLSNWCSLFSDKDVIILYHNDHPRQIKVGKSIQIKEPASLIGIRRTVSSLVSSSKPPRSISYLKWGQDSYDPSLKPGYDINDHLRRGSTIEERRRLWHTLSQKIDTVPKEWMVKSVPTSINIQPITCTSWKDMINSWYKAMEWFESGEGLDYGLSVMLATVLSTSTQGEQLWLKLVGPPSCGKSVLAEAISVTKKYVKALSTMRGLYSGYKTGKSEDEDSSLVVLIRDKTLVIKDGDTLAKSVYCDKILSEMRDIYDGAGRSHYNNRMGKNYEGWRFTLIICGTEAYMDRFDRSELGERFIDCVLLDSMNEETEEQIGWRVALREARQVCVSVNGVPESLMAEEMVEAKSKTGGYVEYLRSNASDLISKVSIGEEELRYCQYLGTFVSFMRTKQPLDRGKGHPETKSQRELSFRLISQFVRLARCLAAVVNKSSLDTDVMKRVKKVGMDTARGSSLDICRLLYHANDRGLDVRSLAISLNQTEVKVRELLRFLLKIEVVESIIPKMRRYANTTARWQMTDRIRRLYEIIVLEKKEVRYA